VTLYRSWSGYEEDICLDLPFVGPEKSVLLFKRGLSLFGQKRLEEESKEGFKIWKPANPWEKGLLQIRDSLWAKKINHYIRKYDLLNFDIYHLDGGLDLFRDGRFLKEVKARGKKVVCYYHGQDLRIRGVIPVVDALSDLNLTCEFDLFNRYPKLKYLFLPFNTSQLEPRRKENRKLKICHSPTNRSFKGTAKIIEVCKALEREWKAEFVLIEGKSHAETIEIKKTCDIAIDQIADGDLGYGVSSLETLSLAIPTCTFLSPVYEAFIPDHPFINVNENNLKEKLLELIDRPELREEKGLKGREWVERYHEAKTVVRKLYQIYEEMGWSN